MYNACTPTHPLHYSACLPICPHIALCHRYPAIVSHDTPHARSLARPTLTITPASCARRTLPARVFFLSVSLTPAPPRALPYALAVHSPAQSPASPHPPSRLLAPPIGYLLCYPAPSPRPPYSLYVPPYLGPPNYLRTLSPPRHPRGRTRTRRTRTHIRPLY